VVTKPRRQYGPVRITFKPEPTVGRTTAPAARVVEHDDFDWDQCAADWNYRFHESKIKQQEEERHEGSR